MLLVVVRLDVALAVVVDELSGAVEIQPDAGGIAVRNRLKARTGLITLVVGDRRPERGRLRGGVVVPTDGTVLVGHGL